MAKRELSGSLEEQCDFLYQMAREKLNSGNYTGAAYALKEIVAHNPGYRDAEELLAFVRQQKRSQSFRLVVSLLGAILFIGFGTVSGLRNDLILFGLAGIGLLVGYGVANLWSSFRHT